MASASSAFKIKCPSCEASVSIRDPGLVGKKVDCPKCKYRFVVELPSDVSGDDDDDKPSKKGAPQAKKKSADEAKDPVAKPKGKLLPKRDDDDDDENEDAGDLKKSKKKAGSNTTLLVGGGLGVLAILVLAAAWFGGVFDGEETKKDTPVQSNNPTPANSDPRPIVDNNPPKKDVVAVGPDLSKDDITNLLPKESQWILKLNGREFLDTPVGSVLFENSSESASAFKRLMGFSGDDVEKFVCSGNIESTWFFGVLRLKKEVKLDDLKAAMNLDPDAKTIKTRKLYKIRSNELFKMLGDYLTAKMKALNPIAPKESGGKRDLALNLLDANTLVFGDRKALEQFLEADAKREQLTKYSSPDQAGTTPNTPTGMGMMGSAYPMGAGMMGSPPPKGMMGSTATPMYPGTGMMGTTPMGTAVGPSFSADPSYLTVDPSLKKYLNHLEGDKPMVLALAVKVGDLDKFGGADLMRSLGPQNNAVVPKSSVIAFVVKELDPSKLSVSACMEFPDSQSAQQMATTLQIGAGLIAAELTKILRVPIGTGQAGMGMGTTPYPMGTMPPPLGIIGLKPANPNDPNAPVGPVTSFLKISAFDKLLIADLDVDWKPVYFSYISPSVRSQMDLLKGEVLMMSGRAHWHSIASALKRVEAGGMVPMAAYPRTTNSSRFDLPYPPDDRVSWMADLLPYLGYETLSRRINRQASWNDDANPLPDGTTNLRAGSAWISEFLNPEYPDSTWRALVPSLKGRELGATHFVGLTGIGMDAGEYPDTPEYAKKLGMFGYNRQAKFSDIVTGDGAGNTIFLIQVPPTIQRPWIRGGGSTAQGVLEKGSIKPFVSTVKGVSQGTYAMMADGSIRFLSESIDDNVFKALVTYKGGEKIDNLDKEAPREESKSTSTLVGKAPAEPIKADPKEVKKPN